MHQLANGICVTCQPHELDDGQCVTCRTTASRNFNPTEPRDPHSGEWVDSPTSAISDALKLAGRIDLKPGEHLGGSAKIGDSNGDRSVVLARIDGPGGPRFRLGIVHPEDTGKWRAAKLGSTAELDAAGVHKLRGVLADAPKLGRTSVADYRKKVRAADAADLPRHQWPATEAELSSGTIHNDWGDINWSITRTEGEASLEGIDYPAGGWDLALSIEGDRDSDFIVSDDAARVKKLDGTLAKLGES